MDENKKLVTIAQFPDEAQAHLALASLKNHDIEGFVQDEHITNINWFYSNVTGGVKLQVRASDVNKAMEILECYDKNVDHDTAHELTDLKCPNCGSENIHYEKVSRPIAFLTIVLLGFPLLFIKKEYVCFDCKHKWKDE